MTTLAFSSTLPGPAHGTATRAARIDDLAFACHTILSAPEFSQHAAALQDDEACLRSVWTLFAKDLTEAAVVMPLPPERRPARSGMTWRAVHNTVAALSRSAGMAAHFSAPAGQPSAGRFSSSARRLLQASCQLLVAAPLEAAEGLRPDEVTRLLLALLGLLDGAARWMVGEVEQCSSWPWDSPLQRLQPARLLAQVTARLPAVLRATSGGLRQYSREAAVDVAECFSFCSSPVGLLGILINGGSGDRSSGSLVQSAADLPLWCGTACGLLCVAPLAAEELGADAGEAEGDGMLGKAVLMARVADDLLAACEVLAGECCRSGLHPPAGSDLAAAEAALWQAHTLACRLAHWGAARGATALPDLTPWVRHVQAALMRCMDIAKVLERWSTEGSATGGTKKCAQDGCAQDAWLCSPNVGDGPLMLVAPLLLPSQHCRHLAAMACAHPPALLALLGLQVQAPQGEDARWRVVSSLATAATAGPAALATHAQLVALLSEAAGDTSAVRLLGCGLGTLCKPCTPADPPPFAEVCRSPQVTLRGAGWCRR